MFDSWDKAKKSVAPIWQRDIKLYSNERVSETRYQGVSDTFVPFTFSTVETIVSAMATGDLSTDFIPQDIYKYLTDKLSAGYDPATGMTQQDFMVQAIKNVIKGGTIEDKDLAILNAFYDYQWQSGDWDMRLEELIRSGIKIGNGAWWVSWKNNRVNLETVAFPNFIFDPTAISDDTCGFMGRKYLRSLKDMQDETIIDTKTGEPKKRYKYLSRVNSKDSKTGSNDRTDKELKEEMLFGSTLANSDDNDQVEVVEIMTKDEYFTMVNRKVIAESVENPFKAQARLAGIDYPGIIPGISWANYKDESLYIGKSETSTFWKEQERLNDTTNQKSDAITQSLLRQKRADPSLKAQAKSMEVPGAVIWASAGQYEPIPESRVPSEVFSEEVTIKNNIRETTSTDQIVKGVGSAQDVTATEAKLQVAQSGQRIELKIKSLERGPLKRLARLTLFMFRIFVTDPFLVPRKTSNGLEVMLYDPAKYNFDFEPVIKLSIDAKNQKKQAQVGSTETYKLLISDPTNNLSEVKKAMLPEITNLDKEQIAKISEPSIQSAPQGPVVIGGM